MEVDENERIKSDNSEDEIETVNVKDPFYLHFNKNMSKVKGEEIRDGSRWESSFVNWPSLGRTVVYLPKVKIEKAEKKLLLEEDNDADPPPIGIVPKTPLNPSKSLSHCFLPQKVLNKVKLKSVSALQSEMLRVISQYMDFYYPYATYEKWDKIRTVYSLHSLSHILKSRKQIIQHNNKINRLKLNKKEVNLEYRDTGMTRPKVLILVPFKHSAYKVIKKMMSLLDAEVKNKKRFEKDFGPPDALDKSNQKLDRAEDFDKTFEGDISEDFKIGLTVTKKSLKLYTEFFKSDIIVASPLGLRYSLEVADYNKTAFLSSIEILVMDQADIFLMQNWDHIFKISDELNKMPNVFDLSTDMSRTRKWSLAGLADVYRQTLIFSSTLTPNTKAFLKKCRNLAGKMEVAHLDATGSLADVKVDTELILLRVKTDPSIKYPCSEAQFLHFTKQVLPMLRQRNQSHTLIYIPDYFDYLRLLKYFKDDGGTSVATINEYMIKENSKVAKARSLFFEGKKTFLLYTERFHFYRRYKIKGVRHVVFYEIPTYPHFFPEICNFMTPELQNAQIPQSCSDNSVIVPFQSYDVMKLVGVLGCHRAKEVLHSDKTVHKCDIWTTKK